MKKIKAHVGPIVELWPSKVSNYENLWNPGWVCYIVVLITYVILVVLENAGPLNPRLGARQALWSLGLTLTDYYIKKNNPI